MRPRISAADGRVAVQFPGIMDFLEKYQAKSPARGRSRGCLRFNFKISSAATSIGSRRYYRVILEPAEHRTGEVVESTRTSRNKNRPTSGKLPPSRKSVAQRHRRRGHIVCGAPAAVRRTNGAGVVILRKDSMFSPDTSIGVSYTRIY